MTTPRASLDHIVPYTPGRSIADVKADLGLDSVIKLASNENPFGSPITSAELAACIDSIAMYPDLTGSPLLRALAVRLSVMPDQIIVGNGSDEILTMIGLAYLNPGDHVLTAAGTFSEYSFVAHLMDAVVDTVPYRDYTFDLEAMAGAVTEKTKVIFIANPNNPTGTIVGEAALRRFLNQVPSTTLVVIDEAYAEFVDSPDYPTPIEWIHECPNIIVTRTFSKVFGLAGFRIGYAVAAVDVIATLFKVRQPFNVNSVALTAAELALTKHEFLQKTLRNNRLERQRLEQWCQTHSVPYVPSHANFICLKWGDSADECVRFLLRNGIIVRHLASFGLSDHIRITVGTPDQNTAVMAALTLFMERASV